MELFERLPLREINFLNEMDLKTFKNYSNLRKEYRKLYIYIYQKDSFTIKI
jgi:hypothetical protein